MRARKKLVLMLAFLLFTLALSHEAPSVFALTQALSPSTAEHKTYYAAAPSATAWSNVGSASTEISSGAYTNITTDDGIYYELGASDAQPLQDYAVIALRFTFNISAYNQNGYAVTNIQYRWDGYRSAWQGTMIKQKSQYKLPVEGGTWYDDLTIPSVDGAGWELEKSLAYNYIAESTFEFGLLYICQTTNGNMIYLWTDDVEIVVTYLPTNIIPQEASFRADGTAVNWTARLYYNLTGSFAGNRNINVSLYYNGTWYENTTGTTDNGGWLNFKASKNLPWGNGTWSIHLSDGQNVTAVNPEASYNVSISSFTISLVNTTNINQYAKLGYRIAFTNLAKINATNIVLNDVWLEQAFFNSGGTLVYSVNSSQFDAPAGSYNQVKTVHIPVSVPPATQNYTVRTRMFYNGTNAIVKIGEQNISVKIVPSIIDVSIVPSSFSVESGKSITFTYEFTSNHSANIYDVWVHFHVAGGQTIWQETTTAFFMETGKSYQFQRTPILVGDAGSYTLYCDLYRPGSSILMYTTSASVTVAGGGTTEQGSSPSLPSEGSRLIEEIIAPTVFAITSNWISVFMLGGLAFGTVLSFGYSPDGDAWKVLVFFLVVLALNFVLAYILVPMNLLPPDLNIIRSLAWMPPTLELQTYPLGTQMLLQTIVLASVGLIAVASIAVLIVKE